MKIQDSKGLRYRICDIKYFPVSQISYIRPPKPVNLKRFRPILFITVCASLLSACTREYTNSFYTMIPIDGLFPVSGSGSTLGQNSQAALLMGIQDVNLYFTRTNSSYRLSSFAYDTKGDPQLAVSQFQTASANGIRFVIGPQSDSELVAIQPLLAGSNMLLVSARSNAFSLANPGDALFRFMIPEPVEGSKLAQSAYDSGYRLMISVARNEPLTVGLQNATGSSFTLLGGAVSSLDPYAPGQTDYSALVAQIKNRVNDFKSTYPLNQIVIYLSSYEEFIQIFQAAASDPDLRSVHWMGSSAVPKSAALATNATAAAFALSTRFIVPQLSLPAAAKTIWEPVSNRIKKKTGIDADAYALAVYDAVWVIGKTIEANDGLPSDINALISSFTTAANNYSGATGATTLDANGDRSAAHFDFWGIRPNGSTYGWAVTGVSN